MALITISLMPVPAFAQAPAMPAPQAPQQGQSTWEKMPRMQLERQFAGPLQDTIIQRWRDPVDGTACYIYLPITVQHTPPTPAGFVQYGPNQIGTISCVESRAPARSNPPRP